MTRFRYAFDGRSDLKGFNKITKIRLKWHAYATAAALLESIVDTAELACEETLPREHVRLIREYIRTRVVQALRSEAGRQLGGRDPYGKSKEPT